MTTGITFNIWPLQQEDCDPLNLSNYVNLNYKEYRRKQKPRLNRSYECNYNNYAARAKTLAAIKVIKEKMLEGEIHKLVVFTVDTEALKSMIKELKPMKAASIYKGMGIVKKERRVSRFVSQARNRILICYRNIDDVGKIHNVCNHAIFIHTSWIEEENLNCIKLLYRDGQEKPVNIDVMSLTGTKDEQVQKDRFQSFQATFQNSATE